MQCETCFSEEQCKCAAWEEYYNNLTLEEWVRELRMMDEHAKETNE